MSISPEEKVSLDSDTTVLFVSAPFAEGLFVFLFLIY